MALSKFVGLLAAVLPLACAAPTPGMTTEIHPEVLAAMKRDLGLDAEQATARIARELSANEVIEQLKTTAGDSFAGAWLEDDGQTISIGLTDEALASEVTAAGATPVIFANSLSKLEEAKIALDNLSKEPKILSTDSGIAAWYVDIVNNKVVLEALASSTEEAKELAAQVGLVESEFEVRTVEELPTTFIRGGDAYLIGGSSRCSVGFAVTTGFVSAGHCGRTGASTTLTTGAALGTFSGSVFPGSADMAFIRTVSGTALTNAIAGSGQVISGTTVAAVGASICRSGSTTGVSCGAVRQLGATVNYSQGAVTGLTATSACAEPGDSGGPYYSGAQAQGVLSGGSGNCQSGGTTYFQPVNEILSTYGLTLVR